jgi:hypothetical protein
MTNLRQRHKKVATRVLILVIGLLCLIGWVGAPVAAAGEWRFQVGAEELRFELSTDWKVASSHVLGNRQLMIEFVRKGGDINNWKELFTYQNFAKGKQTPEEFLNKLKAEREKECPGATVWNVIEQNESSILYEDIRQLQSHLVSKRTPQSCSGRPGCDFPDASARRVKALLSPSPGLCEPYPRPCRDGRRGPRLAR